MKILNNFCVFALFKTASVLSIIETGDEGIDVEEGMDEEDEEENMSIMEGEENEEDLTLSGGVTEGSGTQDSEASLSGADADVMIFLHL